MVAFFERNLMPFKGRGMEAMFECVGSENKEELCGGESWGIPALHDLTCTEGVEEREKKSRGGKE